MTIEISSADKARFATVQRRAEELGVLDINFSSFNFSNDLESYERTLDIIEKNKAFLDRNAGEA
ncbi:MAG: hypothetical protein LBV68_04945 [Spirochaetaceae bacterium]|jgi:hypothetical protein|nr:hypothetical protein [Spirochaetaceae bacterium]